MPVILATDLIVYFIVTVLIALALKARHKTGTPARVWTHIKSNKTALICMCALILYCLVALSDSIRWRDAIVKVEGNTTVAITRTESGETLYSSKALSILDRVFASIRENSEKTFSAPLATRQFVKETIEATDGTQTRDYPPLKHPGAHLLGTDKVGDDVFFAALKGVRTGVVIGAGTTLIIIPFAIFFGVLAGFYGGIIDDIIQYIYTTLSSIPDILLIVAFMLIFGAGGYQGGLITEQLTYLGIFIPNDRLFWLCLIMGITSWTGLCRIIRGETLKLRELQYVEAARAFGVPRLLIIYRHIVPNIMHLALITLVLQFSGLVLAEAILSYLGIGVGAEMGSWGNMINTARLELSREPVVWWNLFASFIFMLGLVLPANIFGDAIRDALDPRLGKGRK
jgi:peptide/nickel transport system permease protein